MEFDPNQLDKELARLLEEADRDAQMYRELDEEDERDFAGLIAQAGTAGFDLPAEMIVDTGSPNERPMTLEEFNLLHAAYDTLPQKSKDALFALSKLHLAKGYAVGREVDDAVKSRNQALGMIFISDEFDEGQKDAFLRLTDAHLAGLVDPVEMLDAPDAKAEFGHQVLLEAVQEDQARAHNHAINNIVRTGIDEALRRLRGEHDELDNLRENILRAATYIAYAHQAEDASVDEDTLTKALQSCSLDQAADRFDINSAELIRLVLEFSSLLQMLDYKFKF